MIEASQRMITTNNQGGKGRNGGRINPAIKRHLELEIKTLEIVQRDADKLRRLLEAKEREEEFWTISASPLFITTVRRKGSIMIVYGPALLV
jgi:hypothetical protein